MAKAKNTDHGPLVFPSNVEVNDEIPSQEKIAKIADYPVVDVDGKEVPFRSLYEGVNGGQKNHKVLVIFIRHFYCGSCQDFLDHISKGLPSPAELEALPTPASIAIIGCGSHSLIPFYAKKASCPFPIYAEPTRYVYSVLEMTTSKTRSAQLPEYITDATLIQAAMRGIGQIISRVPHGDGWKGGSPNQVGGDFLFENGKVVWCHRMRDATDHCGLPKIRELFGLPPI